MENKGKYLYGIIEANEEKELSLKGLYNRGVYTIPYNDISAVVSDSPLKIGVTKETVFTHDKVIRAVMEKHTIIPIGFGTVALNKADVINILEKGYAEFKSTLKRIGNKLQFNVKALCNINKLFIEILNENQDIKKEWELVKNEQTESDKIELGKKVSIISNKKKEAYAKEVHNSLSNLHVNFIPNKFTDEKMLINTSFLIDKEKEKKWYEKIDELDDRYGDKVQVISVGPLPPYDFVRVDTKIADFRAIDEARKLLGLGEEAVSLEIETSYQNLVSKYHPDKNPKPSAKEKFTKIEKAYSLLSNYIKNYPDSICSFRKENVEKTFIFEEKESTSDWRSKYKIVGDKKLIMK